MEKCEGITEEEKKERKRMQEENRKAKIMTPILCPVSLLINTEARWRLRLVDV